MTDVNRFCCRILRCLFIPIHCALIVCICADHVELFFLQFLGSGEKKISFSTSEESGKKKQTHQKYKRRKRIPHKSRTQWMKQCRMPWQNQKSEKTNAKVHCTNWLEGRFQFWQRQ